MKSYTFILQTKLHYHLITCRVDGSSSKETIPEGFAILLQYLGYKTFVRNKIK